MTSQPKGEVAMSEPTFPRPFRGTAFGDVYRRTMPLAGRPHEYAPKWSDVRDSICQCGLAMAWCKRRQNP